MDTTGLAYRSKDRFLRFRRGKEVRRVRGHARLLALMRWDRERRLLWPWGGVAGEGYAPDPRLGGEVLRRFPPSGGWLLGDAGFDGKEVWGALGEVEVRPVIRLRGGGEARDEARVRAREGWDPEVYRFRGVVEGVFGGMKTRLGGGYLMERKPWTAMARAFLELIAYGLRVLLSLLPPPPGYKAIY
ncbi:transposase [Thermus thermophilus]|nr:transposase [Thermus thermophilus]